MELILYSTGCPKCRMLEAALKKKDASYEKCEDVQAMIDMGLSEAPVLKVDGKVLSYNDAMKFVMEEM